MMQKMDKDNNGKVTWEEFVSAASNKIALLNEEKIKSAFKVLDINGDG
jgi:Ca2+-binding EF-hand superfamily protein